MKAATRSSAILFLFLGCACAAFAADPVTPPAAPGTVKPDLSPPDFSPPPVPEFMLRKPAKPLTLEEMQQQADEAARRARAERDGRAPTPQKPPAKDDEGKTK